jgi:drug/metabolite transporter (DMT)-like permease
MVITVNRLASLNGIVKIVNDLGMYSSEIVFLLNLFGVISLILFFVRVGFLNLGTLRLKIHIHQGVIHATSMIAWFWALTVIFLADATALIFKVPVFASIGVIVFMKESSKLIRWVSITISFAGMLIILRPGFTRIEFGTWMVLSGAIVVKYPSF